MKLVFQPPFGAERLPFGTPRDEVRSGILKGLTFWTPPNEPENDMYKSEGLILGFDDKELLEFIEVISPSSCSYAGMDLLGIPLDNLLEEMASRGHTSESAHGSHNFLDLGIVLYCPGGEIESASIYREGYYDV